MKNTLFFVVIFALTAYAESLGLGPGSLSGWHNLPCSDILSRGSLRLGTALEYTSTDEGSILVVPLRGCWGFGENMEMGVSLPLVPVDNAWNGSFAGDVTLAGGWQYETTRGGTALKLTGRLSLPTGEEYRDRGTEIALGGVTSTTFLDFRLSVSGEYALNGGRNPLDDPIHDVFYFTAGGTSYITPDILLSAQLNGSTSSVFQAGTGIQFIIDENLSADCGATLGLNDFENFGFNAGVFWTGQGF